MATKTKAKKKRKVDPRQQDVPGTEMKRIPAIRNAALKLAEIRSERIPLTKREKQAIDTLLDKLRENKVDKYEDDAVKVWIPEENQKVRVRVAGAGGEDDD